MKLTRAGCCLADFDPSATRAALLDHGYLHVAGFFDPALLALALAKLEDAPFEPMDHDGIGHELAVRGGVLFTMLTLLCNDRRLLAAISEIVGRRIIGFRGRIYRMVPGEAHYDSWHSDVDGYRCMALSVNLGEPFRGGELRLRRRGTADVLATVANVAPGGGLLFPIDERFEHRVEPVVGDVPKTAWAGWFVDR